MKILGIWMEKVGTPQKTSLTLDRWIVYIEWVEYKGVH